MCVYMFLGLFLCFPECCLIYSDQRENLTHTRSSLGKATGEIILGYERCLNVKTVTCFLAEASLWPEAKGVEEMWLHLSDSAWHRCDPTMKLSPGVCLVCEEVSGG